MTADSRWGSQIFTSCPASRTASGTSTERVSRAQPIVVTAGNRGTDLRHEEPILTGDLVKMTGQFTKWSAEVLDVSALPSMLRRAFRVAATPPTGPVFLALPYDVPTAETEAAPESIGEIPTAGRGDARQIERAADLLADADNPAMVLGDGVARPEPMRSMRPSNSPKPRALASTA